MDKQLKQDRQYTLPYHYLPHEDPEGVWKVGLHLFWGFEYLAILEKVRKLVVSHNPERVLDFGCGDGRLIKELLKVDIIELVGVDISERAIAFAKASIFGNANVFLHKSLDEIDQAKKFSVIVAMEVLEHILPSKTKAIIRELHELIHPSGVLIVSVPTINVPVNPKHYRHFTLETLEEELQEMFLLETYYFVHRVGFMANWIRRMVVNRFFVSNYPHWLRLMTWLYKRFVMEADWKTGQHLVAVFKPKY